MVQLPPVVSPGEWRMARKAFLVKEKEFTRARDALNAERRELPMVEVAKRYVFRGPVGTEEPAGLIDMFDGRRQLIVYHFMFDPDWEQGCPMCSFLVDNIGHLSHLRDARDTNLVLVSRAPLGKVGPFQRRMSWTVPWYSSHGSDFNYDFHVSLDESVTPVEYNYRDKAELEQAGLGWLASRRGEHHGLSVFLRDGARVFHTYSTYARGGDLLLGTYNYLDLTPLGRQEDDPGSHEFLHHDRYTTQPAGSYDEQPGGGR
jgi:predicted dithiol-disulfide oxidoreductase (DUF899 family)